MSHKKSPTIALVSDAVLPFHNGGKEARIDQLSRRLVARGYDVHIYTMKWWPEPSRTFSRGGITYHAISKLYPLYNGKRRSFKEGIMFGLACLKLVRADYDILEVDHMPYFPLFSIKVVSLLKRKPFFATWHEAVGLRAWRGYIGYLPGTIAYGLERLGAKMPNHIIAVSARTFGQVRESLRYNGPMTLVSNGIDYATIAAAKPAKTRSDIIYTGRLVKHKHVDLLIRAVAELKKKRPDVSAVIVGTGPEQQRLAALVAELGLGKSITMLGRLEHSQDVFSYMKSSKVFVSPSTREGFGITILEAYACGLDVVTVDHPDNAARFLVRPEAGAVCELSELAIAAAAEKLLKRPGNKSAIDARSFDWDKSVELLVEAYGL